MMANLVTSSEQKGVIATKIAKVNEEVSVLVQLEIHVCMTTKYLLALDPLNGFPMGSIKVSSSKKFKTFTQSNIFKLIVINNEFLILISTHWEAPPPTSLKSLSDGHWRVKGN